MIYHLRFMICGRDRPPGIRRERLQTAYSAPCIHAHR